MTNFIDAELHTNLLGKGQRGKTKSDITSQSDESSMSTESMEEHSTSAAENWIGIPNPKNAELGPAPFMKRLKPGTTENETESIPVHCH